MANLSRNYKRFMAVGCSHGHLADPDALKAVLAFKRRFKPHRTFHLGDFTDQAAFRSGAAGTRDESVSIEQDLRHGLNFLKELRPTDLLNGNHEIRLWNMAGHPNELKSRAAASVINEIRDLARRMKTNYVEHYDITRSWIQLADTKFLHGFMYGENGIRDHAEHFGKCCIAHLHIADQASGRRADNPKAYCVGTLANIPSMDYALRRRATARWRHGIVYGHFDQKTVHMNLSECPPNEAANWRLPL